MSAHCLRQVRFRDAQGHPRQQDVFIEQGRITALGDQLPTRRDVHEIAAQGHYLMPGWTDLCARVHRDGLALADSIASETRAALRGGCTRLLLPPDGQPLLDQSASLKWLQELEQERAHTQLLATAALTRALQGEQLTEMALLQGRGAVAAGHGDVALHDLSLLRNAMLYAASFELPLILQPCHPQLSGQGQVHGGVHALGLGLPSQPESAETVAILQILELARETGARVHLSRISSARSVALIRAAKDAGQAISADVAIANLWLSDAAIAAFDARYKVWPPLRSTQDRDALRRGLQDGTLDAICSNHQPQSPDARHAPFTQHAFGMSTLDSLAARVLMLAETLEASDADILRWMVQGPAHCLGQNAPTIGPGCDDMILLDPAPAWQLQTETLYSQGENTPWLNVPLRGAVRHVWRAGRHWQPDSAG